MNAESSRPPEDFLKELRSLVEEAEKILAEASDPHSESAIGALRERMAQAQARVAEACEGIKTKVTAEARDADRAIRDNPYASLAIAAGVGVLVGLLIGHRKK
jgi:ElaB/YqjD/DUF883 family membrane-anchored ribosome-binding protein